MFGITPFFQGETLENKVTRTNLKLNATFNEHTLIIHERVYRKTDNSGLQERHTEHLS